MRRTPTHKSLPLSLLEEDDRKVFDIFFAEEDPGRDPVQLACAGTYQAGCVSREMVEYVGRNLCGFKAQGGLTREGLARTNAMLSRMESLALSLPWPK